MAPKTALLVSVLCLGWPALVPATTAAQARCSWQVVPPDPGSGGLLFRVNALSDSDAWTVGDDGNATLAEHWDGATWKTVPTPPPAPGYRENLEDVADLAPDDAWAVGVSFAPENGPGSTLVEHWNGSGWSVVPSPDPGFSNQLTSMDAVSSSDIWAVGFSKSGLYGSPLIEHWDGTSWSVVPGPPISGALGGVSAVSADDVWSAGYETSVHRRFRAVVIHWDGASWTEFATFANHTAANDIAALAADDAWSVGPGPSTRRLWSAHWNGSGWRQNIPEGSPSEQLYGVAMTPDSHAWAVGYTNFGSIQGVTEYWDRGAWQSVSIPVSGESQLIGVAAVPGSNAVWAVGKVFSTAAPLILHRC